MNKQKRIEIFTRLREANPNPTTELNYSSPFELLIAGGTSDPDDPAQGARWSRRRWPNT